MANDRKGPSALLEGIRFFENRFTFFLFSIILLFLIEPLVADRTEPAFPFVHFFFSAIIITIFWTLRLRRAFFSLYIVLALATLAADIFHFFHVRLLMRPAIPNLEVMIVGAFAILIFAAIVTLMWKLFTTSEVTTDTIRGGFAVYLLLGFFWALLYQIFLLANPESIAFPDAVYSFSTLLYYSFTTLTTLGYGDILPIVPIVRNVAVLEAVFGQIFLVSFIARLIGLHIADRQE